MRVSQVGIPVRVIERESGPRREGTAIGLWPNAFRALDALGVAEPLREAHPLFDRYITGAAINKP
jgi:2-polyprenyl-6-methoxyphenol hydroxylase-like FAD-dependent oxidoreductase